MARENAIADIVPVPEPTRSNYVSYVGLTFNRFTVVAYAGMKGANRRWYCRCECGVVKICQSGDLRCGKVKSCGCWNTEVLQTRNTKHGMSRRPEYAVWSTIIDRCENPRNRFFPNYGGRGIAICQEWRHDFGRFFSDMGPRPPGDMTIERRDTNGPYCKQNCYWADRTTQANNKRNNRMLTARGMTMSMSQWAKIVPTPYSTIRSRKRLGYTDDQAIYGLGA